MPWNDLPDYMTWAHTRTVQMLHQSPSAEGERIFAHLLAAERVWGERLAGQPMSCPIWPEWTLPECEGRIAGNVDLYRELLGVQDAPEDVHYRNSRGEEFTSARADILLHVMAHGAYHRGQISQEVRRLGGEILDTDYILFQRR